MNSYEQLITHPGYSALMVGACELSCTGILRLSVIIPPILVVEQQGMKLPNFTAMEPDLCHFFCMVYWLQIVCCVMWCPVSSHFKAKQTKRTFVGMSTQHTHHTVLSGCRPLYKSLEGGESRKPLTCVTGYVVHKSDLCQIYPHGGSKWSSTLNVGTPHFVVGLSRLLLFIRITSVAEIDMATR